MSSIPRRTGFYIWPEVLVGVVASAIVVALWMLGFGARSIDDLGIPVQVVAAIFYGVFVGAFVGLLIGLALFAAATISRRFDFGFAPRVVLSVTSLIAIVSLLAWLVPAFHATSSAVTPPYFIGGAVVIALIDVLRNIPAQAQPADRS